MGMLMAMTQAKQREEEAKKRQNPPLESPAPSAERVEEPVKEAVEQPKRKPVVRHTVKRK